MLTQLRRIVSPQAALIRQYPATDTDFKDLKPECDSGRQRQPTSDSSEVLLRRFRGMSLVARVFLDLSCPLIFNTLPSLVTTETSDSTGLDPFFPLLLSSSTT
jgi:hypothetical protein